VRGRHTHFIGIGGVGMSGLAELLLSAGEQVSGCDRRPSPITERLAALGATIQAGHDPSHLPGVDRVVLTDAIQADNPELLAAQAQGLAVLRRTELLAELMSERQGIAVTGTHGKTTVTAMISLMLLEAGLDPVVLVGGEVPELGGNYRAGAGPFLVTEACEAYGGFLDLHPRYAIITNMEPEHLDYYRDLGDMADKFARFARQVSPQGVLAICADRPELAPLARAARARVVTYGLGVAAQYRAQAVRPGDPTRFAAWGPAGELGELVLWPPGEHMVTNAMGALALSLEAGASLAAAAAALARFRGVERRFQVLGEARGITVVDDYAHHPTEIRATLAAARPRCAGRLVAVFQPHLFSRTQHFLADFATSFDQADVVIFTDIYAARENPLPGVDAQALAREAARARPGKDIRYVGPKDEVCPGLLPELAAGDWVITLGAGDVDHVAHCLVGALQEQPAR